MATGDFWNVDNPKRPVGELDVEGVYDVPWDWSEWLAEISATVGTHTITPTSPLEIVESSQIEGNTKVIGRVKVGAAYVEADHLNKKFPVTCHIVASDGQEEDQTLWFKIVEK